MDVIDIMINNCKFGYISMEVLNGMTHIWSNSGLEVEILTNTFIINVKEQIWKLIGEKLELFKLMNITN